MWHVRWLVHRPIRDTSIPGTRHDDVSMSDATAVDDSVASEAQSVLRSAVPNDAGKGVVGVVQGAGGDGEGWAGGGEVRAPLSSFSPPTASCCCGGEKKRALERLQQLLCYLPVTFDSR